MKKYGLLLLLLSSIHGTSYANVWENENIILTKEVFKIEQIAENKATIERIQTYTNQSDEPQSFTLFIPVTKNTSNIKIYDNFDGLKQNTWQNKNKLEMLFEKAKEQNNPKYFELGNPLWDKVLETGEINIPKNEAREIKTTYEAELIQKENWHWLDIFIEKESTHSREFFIKLKNNHFFFSNLLDFPNQQSKTKEGEQKSIYLNLSDRTIPENIFLGWITKQELKTTYENLIYTTIFKKEIPQEIKNITILADTSGSINNDKWNKTKNFLQFLINNQYQDKNIRFGTFSDTIKWETKNEEKEPIFQENTFKWKQEINNKISLIRPLGKTNIISVLKNLQTLEIPQNHQIIIITDEQPPETTFEIPENIYIFVFHKPEQSLADSWNFWLRQKNGTAYNLFESQTEIIDKDNIKNELSTSTSKELSSSGLFDVFQNKELLVGRSERKNINNYPTQTIWGRLKLANLINQGIENQFTTEINDALNAVKVVFGINIDIDTTKSNQELAQLAWQLQTQGTQKTYSIGNTPVYNQRTYNYDQQNNALTELNIAPYSEVQKEIFTTYPELVAEGFSKGEEISFCTYVRCITVSQTGDQTSTSYTKAYFNEKDLNHWSLPYVKPLVWNGIYPIAENGDLKLTEPISRGEFAQLLYDMINTSRWRKGPKKTFTDLPKDHPNFEAISWFSEHKIIEGYEDETVKPENPITRAESMKILLATDLYKPREDEELLFDDTNDWTLPWVNEAARRGIIKGYEKGSTKIFKPHEKLTYGQAAKVITIFVE